MQQGKHCYTQKLTVFLLLYQTDNVGERLPNHNSMRRISEVLRTTWHHDQSLMMVWPLSTWAQQVTDQTCQLSLFQTEASLRQVPCSVYMTQEAQLYNIFPRLLDMSQYFLSLE